MAVRRGIGVAALAVLGRHRGRAVARARRAATLAARARGARAVVVLGVGLVAILWPRTILSVVVVLVGAALVYAAVGELLSVTAPARPAAAPLAWASPSAGVATVAERLRRGGRRFVLAFVLDRRRAVTRRHDLACNGYPQLCDRRLDEVVFAGTHNSMSAADSHGWLIANQDRDVAQQLEDGIRLFKISTHYARRTPAAGSTPTSPPRAPGSTASPRSSTPGRGSRCSG